MITGITLKTKIYLLASIASFFLVVVIWDGYNDLKNLSIKYSDSRNISIYAKENIFLSRKVEELKNNVQKFINYSSQSSSNDVHRVYKNISNILQNNKVPQAIEHQESILLIKKHLKKYFHTFEDLQKQVISRKKLKIQKRTLIQEIEKSINSYFKKQYANNSKNLQYEVYNDLRFAEKYALYYFDTLETMYIKKSKKYFSFLKKKIILLIDLEDTQVGKNHLKKLQEDIDNYAKVINKEIQHTKAYTFLINVVMAAETYEVNYHAKIISNESQRILKNFDEEVELSIEDTKKKIIISGFFLVLLLILLSFIIIRSIIRPLDLLTKSFSDISLGKINNIIPKYEVDDEIGKLTNAANVFSAQNKLMYQQSRLAQMGEMISMIAHQWRQPLSAISTVAALVQIKLNMGAFDTSTEKGKLEKDEFIKEQLTKITSYVMNLSSTIDDFRNFYKHNKQVTSIKLSEIVNKSLAIIQTSLQNNNITINIIDNANNTVDVYDSELMQVVLNILKNAEDNFLENNTQQAILDIKITDTSIRITDNGGGIKEELLEKIFDPYFSTKDSKNGTGLGLYMSKTIIEEHHKGTLTVKNIDNGVCFTITLGV